VSTARCRTCYCAIEFDCLQLPLCLGACKIDASAYSTSRLSISRLNPPGSVHASAIAMHGIEKRIVYIIRSDVEPSRHYIGITNALPSRLHWHNHGPSGHTLCHRPWSMVVSLEFPTAKQAVRFEKYLKSGSGRAFARRHFGPSD
jgi:predicted GIY-YIG superfamily endonuclease